MSTTLEGQYLRDAILTATPEQLHLMLYDGAIRFCNQARDAIERKDYETSYDRLTRAQNVVLEMQSGLRHELNPELCGRVSGIYTFLYNKLLEANIGRNIKEIDDALRVLHVERETWQILVDKVNRIRQSESGATDESGTANEDGSAFSTCG